MDRIMWNTNVNAPCCPGEIVNDDKQTILIQTDWDHCGVATSFGWSTREVQLNRDEPCGHSFSDGTIDCPECGLTANEFIDDPGYFGA